MHAMASSDGEDPNVTKRKIMAWARFTWGIAIGESQLDDSPYSMKIDGFDSLFKYNREWRVQDLFGLGNPQIRKPDRIARVAVGSLLHMVQDSYAGGHVDRQEPTPGRMCPGSPLAAKPGSILEFHSYGKQDHGKHGDSDRLGAFAQHHHSINPGAVTAGQELHKLFLIKAPWTVVEPYLDCVFTLSPDVRKSSAGFAYQ